MKITLLFCLFLMPINSYAIVVGDIKAIVKCQTNDGVTVCYLVRSGMTLKYFLISQNVKVPEKKQLDGIGEYITGKEVGRNEMIDELLSIELPEQRKGLSVEEIKEVLRPIPSTHIPISEMNGKYYYYMCKDDIATAIHEALGGEK